MLKKHLENRGFVVGVYKPPVRMAIKCYLQLVLGQILQRDDVHAIVLNLAQTALALGLKSGHKRVGGGKRGHAGDAAANRRCAAGNRRRASRVRKGC